MPRPVLLFVAALVAVAAPSSAQADDPPQGLTPPAANQEEAASFGGLADGRVGFGMIDEDWFLSVNIGTAFHWGKFGIGVQVPLRFRVIDEDPETDDLFRHEDWDEVSDWTRVVRYISWGNPNDWLYVRLGVLQGTTLGHGTIVDRYYNTIDADHYQTGIQFHLDMEYAGGTFFLDNLIDPELFGTRGYVRPLKFTSLPEWAHKLVVGTTLVVDAAAPLDSVPDGNNFNRVVTEDGDLLVDTSSAFLWGFDIGWEFAPTDWVALTPYMDINVLGATGGAGFHLGLLSTFNIADVVTLGTRIEYRAMDGDYAPSYVNSWYEVERIDFLGGKTKLRHFVDLDEAGEDETVHGWHASLDVTIMNAITISGILEDYQGPNNANLMLRLVLPYIAGVKLSAYYAKRNFDDASEAFDLDRGMLVAEAKYKFWGPMFVFARYSREWRLNKDPAERAKPEAESQYGEYETINDFDLGVGVEFTF